MKKRSIASVILFTILTCGIYGIYWFVVVTNEIEEELGDKSDGCCKSGGLAFLFSLLTCGIYGIYWWYKEAQRVVTLGEEKGLRLSDNGIAYILLSVFGFSIVSTALLQADLNKIADAISSDR